MTARRGPLVARRFVLFLGVLVLAAAARHFAQQSGWADAVVVGFDVAVLAFAASLWPLSRDHCAADMRRHSLENNANRGLVLVLTVVVSAVLMLAMAAELPQARGGDAFAVARLIGTLALGWLFTNLIFMLHYAHMFYSPSPDGKTIAGGFDFPGTPEPDYWDFLYFAFTAGMSFAASDVDVTGKEVRKVVVLHSLLSFAFNIGALAFCINVLAGAAS